MSGWREESVGDASVFRPVPTGVFPGVEYVLNQGVTAYHGMADVAAVQEGDVVFVSGAAGGVGSLAGQIAKALGAKTVIGSAGSIEKAGYLVEELGFDAAINYRDGRITEQLAELAPGGIDVFFDTVGGSHDGNRQATVHPPVLHVAYSGAGGRLGNPLRPVAR